MNPEARTAAEETVEDAPLVEAPPLDPAAAPAADAAPAEAAPAKRSRKRFTPRRPSLRLRAPRLLSVAVLLGLAVVVALLALMNSRLLEIDSVDVYGADVVSPASVRQLAGLKGEHVMLADFTAAEARIAALPMVQSVSVSPDWPNGAKIVIVEREPWGRWRANGTVWAIDSHGVVLEGKPPSADGPIVTQISALPAVTAGAAVDLTAVQAVAALHQRGAPLPLPSVVGYEWSFSEGLVVVTEHGRIVFGDADGLDYKYAVWELLEIEAQNRGEPLLFADLRFGLRPRVDIGFQLGRAVRFHEPSTAAYGATD